MALSTKPRCPSDRVIDYLRLMPMSAYTIAKHSHMPINSVRGALRQLNMQCKVAPAGFDGLRMIWRIAR